jgi:CRP/FNR family cyclic AMP-dependent transcriptional regulator
MRSSDGREANLRLVGRGTWIGLTALVQPTQVQPALERTLISVDRATTISFDTSVFNRVCREYPDVAFTVMQSLLDWTVGLSVSAAQFAFMSVRQRVASHLLRIARPRAGHATELVASTTQQELADAVGSVREVVSRTLHDFREEGLVLVARSRVTVLDEGLLAKSAFDVT